MTARARKRICLVSAALAVVALIPIPYLAAPTWQVWVVDEAGVPIEGMTVRRVYQNYSTERQDHTEDQITDKRGYAAFPARRSSASTVRRCIFTSLSALALVHASFGPHSYVFAYGNGREGSAVSGQYVTDWTGWPEYMKSRITAELLHAPSHAP
jgi:hypothetical protein